MTAPIRLAKHLAKLIPCSRREADLYIAGGWVMVDGQVEEEPQLMVSQQKVEPHPEANLKPIEPVTIFFTNHSLRGQYWHSMNCLKRTSFPFNPQGKSHKDT